VQDVPNFVLKRLQKTADLESHPDADLLTAFAEQSLLESERARVIEHLARCGECREVVALALPASDVVAVTASPEPARNSWSGWPILRWSIAAAAIVAITSVGVLQYGQRHQSGGILDSVLVARKEKSRTAEPVDQPLTASSELQEIRPETKNGERAGAPRRTQSNRQGTSAKDNAARSLNEIFPAPPSRQAASSGIGAGVVYDSGRGQAAAGAELAPNPNLGQQAAVPSSSQTLEVESQAGAVAPTTESRVSDQLVQNQEEQTSTDKSSMNLDLVKASPRWSISSDGKLQRSLDAGNTWVDVNVDSGLREGRSRMAGIAGNTNEAANVNKKVKAQQSPRAGFRALAAFGTEVWAGGSAAMLYYSGDSGAHWTRVIPSSAGVSLTGDVTRIEFSDPRHGAITTSGGDRWITPDAGQTWLRQ
jgi:hypothetical protein